MEKLKRKLEESEKALYSLSEILSKDFTEIVRDATIQRFEYTFEVVWKLLKEYLYYVEGINCNSPKKCFREAFSIGLLNETETLSFFEMTDDRNLTSHTYDVGLADRLYNKIKSHYQLMKSLFTRIKESTEQQYRNKL
jgi:nucleotidyltransferase substrate binding protein (TIGR01987 family)